VNIQIRIGLNPGDVVVRAIGSDLHMDYSAVGQTTHLAARMEQLASPGRNGSALPDYAQARRVADAPLVEGQAEGLGRSPLERARGTAGTTSGRRHGIESNRCEIEVRDSGNYCTIAERRAVYRARDQLEKEQV